jgi:hypothetical protein
MTLRERLLSLDLHNTLSRLSLSRSEPPPCETSSRPLRRRLSLVYPSSQGLCGTAVPSIPVISTLPWCAVAATARYIRGRCKMLQARPGRQCCQRRAARLTKELLPSLAVAPCSCFIFSFLILTVLRYIILYGCQSARHILFRLLYACWDVLHKRCSCCAGRLYYY